jgi:hypothetical protein
MKSIHRQRGAILVEAAITVTTLTLGLLGLAFFRDFYIDQIKVSRLARASALAHSMRGCDPDGQEWLGRDLGTFTNASAEPQNQTAAADPTLGSYAPAADAPPVAGQLLEQAPGTTRSGEGLLNPITTAGVGGEVQASARGSSAAPGMAFQATVLSRSFVSCGDEVRRGDIEEVLDMTKDQLSNFIGMGR